MKEFLTRVQIVKHFALTLRSGSRAPDMWHLHAEQEERALRREKLQQVLEEKGSGGGRGIWGGVAQVSERCGEEGADQCYEISPSPVSPFSSSSSAPLSLLI